MPMKRTQDMTIEDALRDFMENVEAVGLKQAGRTWPDMLVSYNRARMVLERLKNEEKTCLT